MIVFPKEAKYEYIQGSRVVEECKKELEKALRSLGNFKEEPINITEYEYGKNYYDFIYKVQDLDNTLFTFLNFEIGKTDDSENRFEQNYQLTMQREKSNFSYKYNFYKFDHSDYKQELRMIEMSYQLPETRVIRLEREIHEPVRLIIEEKSKKYAICIHNYKEEHDTEVLEDFENIVTRAIKIQNLNLETILTIIENQKLIGSAHIFKEEKLLASVCFHDNNISEYQINDSFRTIKVTIGDHIKREVTRELNGEKVSTKEELTEGTYEKLQSDYKRLFKQL